MAMFRELREDVSSLVGKWRAKLYKEVKSRVDSVQARVWDFVTLSLRIIGFLFLAAMAFFWALALAALIYFGLYYRFMPAPYHSAAANFDFSSEKVPIASVNLLNKQWAYAENGNNSSPSPDQPRLLYGGQLYNIFLDMRLPDSPVNQHVGMLNIKMEIYTKQPVATNGNGNGNGHSGSSSDSNNGNSNSNSQQVAAVENGLVPPQELKLVATSIRPFIPEYSSDMVRWLWRTAFAVPLVTGWIREDQRVSLVMFDEFLEQPESKAAFVKISLLGPGAQHFQLYEATVKFITELRGLKYLAYHWFLTSAVFWITVIFCLEIPVAFILLVVLWRACCSRTEDTDGEGNERADNRDRGQAFAKSRDGGDQDEVEVRQEDQDEADQQDEEPADNEDGQSFHHEVKDDHKEKKLRDTARDALLIPSSPRPAPSAPSYNIADTPLASNASSSADPRSLNLGSNNTASVKAEPGLYPAIPSVKTEGTTTEESKTTAAVASTVSVAVPTVVTGEGANNATTGSTTSSNASSVKLEADEPGEQKDDNVSSTSSADADDSGSSSGSNGEDWYRVRNEDNPRKRGAPKTAPAKFLNQGSGTSSS